MNKDGQIVHHLWWLRDYLNKEFDGKEYKDIINNELNTDICRELDELVAHIKENY